MLGARMRRLFETPKKESENEKSRTGALNALSPPEPSCVARLQREQAGAGRSNLATDVLKMAS